LEIERSLSLKHDIHIYVISVDKEQQGIGESFSFFGEVCCALTEAVVDVCVCVSVRCAVYLQGQSIMCVCVSVRCAVYLQGQSMMCVCVCR